MNLHLLLRSVRAESRGARARLFFFTVCLGVGVAAVVGVAGLTDAIADGVAAESRKLLAADVRIGSSFELPDELDAVLEEVPGARRAEVLQLNSMVTRPARSSDDGAAPPSLLAELKAIEDGYPFYGELVTDPPDERARLDAESVLVGRELFGPLDVGIGDEVAIGGASFTISGLVVSEPDRVNFTMTLGPRVFLTREGLDRTGLRQFGSRIRYRALYAAPEGLEADLVAAAENARRALRDPHVVRVETPATTEGNIGGGLERVERFLGLVALLSLVLGGIGVAQIARTWIAERTPDVAVRRALGFRPRDILVLYLAQVSAMALAGSTLGAAVGATLPFLAPRIAPEFLRPDLVDPFQPGAIATGLALGLAIALVFALPPLTAVWRVSPARVLRAEADPLPQPRAVRLGSAAVVLAGLFGAAWVQSRDLAYAGAFAGGLLVVGVVLFLAARGVTALSARLPHRGLSPYVVHGLAALGRPGQGTPGAVVALGLGVMVVTMLVLVERHLEAELDQILPERAPTTFLVDIQPDQWSGVEALLDEEGADNIDSVPVVTARLRSIDGREIHELARDRSDRRRRGGWALSREQRITWLEELPEDNELVAGELWSDPDAQELSIEADFAEDLGLELGSEVVFDVQGVDVPLRVTSLRTVEWESFAINFFLVAEPGTFDAAPHFRIAAARMEPDEEERFKNRLAQATPNVSLVTVRDIIARVAEVMGKLALGIRVLAGFTLLVGIAVLAGAVSSGGLRRVREAALLKTLGLTRAQVLAFFAVEYALVGLVAGLIGVVGATVASAAFLETVLELEFELPVLYLGGVVLLCAAAATASGLFASTRAVLARPMQTLHGMGGAGA